MKQILFFIILVGIASKSFGQSEFSTKFKAIPPLNTNFKPKKVVAPTPETPAIIAPNVFVNTNILNTKPKKDNSFQMGGTNNFSMVPKNDFVNPGDLIAQKLNKKPDNEDQIVYRKNQNLGDFKTTSLTAKVMYRDYGEIDGDAIQVYLNDKVIVPEVTMTGEFQGFEITLEKGFNKIDFQALNQGTVGPNTAEFKVYDDKGALISASQWNLGTGFKATIILVKE
ncbi:MULTISPECIES: hypothetical protein [unclassified Flavobacterium]|jgi:hypothetical protein|uniref:hypothetical protein n=1 Tax=unclassified Flavobacterium TaxID=196869 RepID=UPI0025C47512|nr:MULTISPECIES: hypothetical protein [unclassified Flavobacterium]